jgi:hypothetical protein
LKEATVPDLVVRESSLDSRTSDPMEKIKICLTRKGFPGNRVGSFRNDLVLSVHIWHGQDFQDAADEMEAINWQFTNEKARIKLKSLYPAV